MDDLLVGYLPVVVGYRDKVAIITGGASGIRRATALLFAQVGGSLGPFVAVESRCLGG